MDQLFQTILALLVLLWLGVVVSRLPDVGPSLVEQSAARIAMHAAA